MKTDAQFQTYFEQVQHLAEKAKTDSATRNLLLQMIQDEMTSSEENPYEEFLKGDFAFFNENYQDALKHYLLCKSIPYYKLFCFRASAYLAKETGNISKTKDFIEKALQIYTDDVPTKQLLQDLNVVENKPLAPLHVTKLPTGIKLPTPTSERPRPHAHATTSEVLTHSIALFHQKQEQLLGDYMEMLESRSEPSENALYVLQGWKENPQKTTLMHLLTQDAYRTAGGFFIRWNGKGIVINPGKHFLDLFHRQGLHIRDIHYVIVTNEDPNTYTEIEEIYNLNYQLNQNRAGLQVIHYYLNPKTHDALAQKLKPNFKQERNMMHCLEIFLDSPEIEKIVLNEDIILTYFPTSKDHANLAMKLELRSRHRETGDLQSISIAYLSNAPWSSYLSQKLGHCDLLIAGFGHTTLDDYSKNSYNNDCLGYHGTYSLMESVRPQLMLCSDFDGREGDIRLEVVKLLRQQYMETHPTEQPPVILPADSKLVLDLMNLHVQCSITSVKVHPLHVSVIKTTEGGGHLQYLSPHCYT